MFFSQKKMLQKQLADTQQQLEALQRQHSGSVSIQNNTITVLNDKLSGLNNELQQTLAKNKDKLSKLKNELAQNLAREATITQECATLKEQLRIITDHVYVKQSLQNWQEQIEAHYEVSKINPYFNGFMLRNVTKKINIHNASAQSARDALVEQVLKQIEQLSTLSEKTAYCKSLFTKPQNECNCYNYEILYLVANLWKHFKETDKDLYDFFEPLLKNQMGIPNSNDLIKERRSTRITAPIASSDNDDHQYKLIFWEILQQCENHDIQTLALYSIVDRCHDSYEYYASFSSDNFLDLYVTPQDYFIAELIAENYPNRPQILQQAVERVCLYEKYYRREREHELMCLLRVAILANAHCDVVQTMFEQIMAIERISITRVLLQWLCDDETLLSICKPQIIWLLDALQKFIKTKPEPYRHIECLTVSCYHRKDVIELWSLHNRTQITEIKSGLSKVAEALDKLWQEQIADYYHETMMKLWQNYSVESRYDAFPIGNNMPLETVHRPQSLEEFDRKVYQAASLKGDRVAKRILANLSSDLITLEELAVAGDVASMASLARHFRNTDKPLYWLRQAAETGDVDSMTSLGFKLSCLSLSVRGVDKNYEEAFTWLQRSANFGDGEAMKYLSELYENGWGVPQDPIKAKEYRVMSATR